MANRKRTNPVQFYLDDDEQYILDEKFRLSGMKSKSAFLRKLILYGYVYDVDYSYLRNYNTELGRISSNLNQIAKRVNSTGNSAYTHAHTSCTGHYIVSCSYHSKRTSTTFFHLH